MEKEKMTVLTDNLCFQFFLLSGLFYFQGFFTFRAFFAFRDYLCVINYARFSFCSKSEKAPGTVDTSAARNAGENKVKTYQKKMSKRSKI